MKSEFISVLSHQLSGPLSAIKWNLEVIGRRKSGRGPADPKQLDFLENVKKSNEKILKLVAAFWRSCGLIKDGRLFKRKWT